MASLDGDGAADALAGAGDDGDAIMECVGGESHGGGAYQLCRAPGTGRALQSPRCLRGATRGPSTSTGGARVERAILEALAGAGRNVDALTIDDLAPTDQFHSGGKDATLRLARVAGARPGLRVLDVGGGLGGPARTLAKEFGCHVTVVDLTESYVRTGAALTARLGLGDRVSHRQGDALTLGDLFRGRPPRSISSGPRTAA